VVCQAGGHGKREPDQAMVSGLFKTKWAEERCRGRSNLFPAEAGVQEQAHFTLRQFDIGPVTAWGLRRWNPILSRGRCL
jgi:hypothetical protein